MAVNFLAEIACDTDRHLYLFLTHHSEAAMSGWTEVVPRNVHLNVVDSFTAAKADSLFYLLRTVGDHTEAFVIHMCFAFVAQATSDRDLRTRRTDAWSGKFARIDGITNDDI